jgi:hypothetical protein
MMVQPRQQEMLQQGQRKSQTETAQVKMAKMVTVQTRALT